MSNRALPALAIVGVGGLAAWFFFIQNKKADAATVTGKPNLEPSGTVTGTKAKGGTGGANVIGGIIGAVPVPGSQILGEAIKTIGGLLGKRSFKPGFNANAEPWRTDFLKVKALKNNEGNFHFSDYGASLVVRYMYSDYPVPDRDAGDTRNRQQMEFYYSEAQRIAAFPINQGIY